MSNAEMVEALELVKMCTQGDTRRMVDTVIALDAETAVRYIMALTTFQAGLLSNLTSSDEAAAQFLTEQQENYRA